MAVTVTHQKVSAVPDSGDSSVVQPSDWNADHTIVGLGSAAEADVGDFATVTQGAKADTAVQPGDLAAVATSGNYDDLVNAPTLGSAAAADTTDFATAAQGGLADSAVQPGDLATVATTGDYDDLSNTPTLGSAAAASTGDFAAAAAGVPSGGTTGQVLAKASGTDHDTEWVDQASGGGGDAADVTFDPSGTGLSATDVQAALEELDSEKANSADLGGAASLNVGTIAGTVAAGDDSRFETVPDGYVTPAKMDNGDAVSVLGRSANSAGVRADISASANDRLLARVSNALSFVQLTAGMIANGIISFAHLASSAIASQGEAEAGSASNKLMTPQRTAQAIAALGGSGGQPIPTTSSLAVGSMALAYAGSVVNNNSTISGGNVRLAPGSSSGALQNDGPTQSGTWKNISGRTLGPGNPSHYGPFVRTA